MEEHTGNWEEHETLRQKKYSKSDILILSYTSRGRIQLKYVILLPSS